MSQQGRNQRLGDEQLARIADLLAERMGWHFGTQRRSDLMRGLEAAGRELGFEDTAACVDRLLAGPISRRQFEVLARHLTTGETYFFRDPRALEILETEILPALIQSRRRGDRRLRLWSAGCATGEEAYTLAILVARVLPDWPDWSVTVLGTDINPLALEHAAAGIYGEWSFRGAPSWLKDRYFQAVAAGRYRLIPPIRNMVTFAPLNLASDVYPSLLNGTNAMDVIACRNVVMYFSPEQACRTVARLKRCLVDDGWLVGSPVEGSYWTETGLIATPFPGAVLYRKERTEPTATRLEIGKEATGEVSAPSPAPLLRAEREHPTAVSLPKPRELPSVPGRLDPAPSAVPEPFEAPVAARGRVDALVAAFERAGEDRLQGRQSEAAAVLERLANENPGRAEVYDLLARIHADQGQLAVALAWSDRAVAADKLNPLYYYLRATVLQELGQWEQAAATLQRALYLDPGFVLAQFALGSLARRRGLGAIAQRHFANALELLAAYPSDTAVPAGEGVTAGRLREIILGMTASEALV